MNSVAINRSDAVYARIAGGTFIALIVVAIYGEFILLGDVFAAESANEIAHNILTTVANYRVAVSTELLAFAGVPILAISLYSVLSRFNKPIAQLALFWRLAEAAIFGVILLNRFVALEILQSDQLTAFSADQINALSGIFLSAYDIGYSIGVIFFSLGSTLFAYLLLKSRYVPAPISIFGIFASLLIFICVFLNLAMQGWPISFPYALPILVFELVLGFWLLVKGTSYNRTVAT